jgi:tetratricopeptide (TPR) repeat protein
MAADPKARYATASEMLADLRDWVTGATNRRASEATAREVEDRLRTAATHQDFVTLNALVADAAEAWPGNPRMPELRRRVQSGWARAALRQGDLSLARAQAEALAPGPERTDLLDLIAARQGRLRRLARQRRVAVTVAVLLLAGYAASLWLGQRKDAAAALEARNANEELENINAELRRERDAVRRERDLARAARSDAEGLVGYMLGSMRRDLLKIGRTDVLGGPTEMAVAYFNRLPDEHRTPATVAAHARALRQRAHLLEELGDTGGALDHYTSATALLRPLARMELMTDEIAEEFARNLDEAADMAQRLGQRGQADRYLDEMFALLEPRAKGAAPPPALLHQYARALHGRASLISRTEPDRALPILEEALGVMKRVLLAQPGDAEMRHTLALTYSRLSETHGLAANAEEEGRNARLALDEFEAIWRENKDDIRYLAGVVHHRMRVADFLVGQRRDREALEVLSTAFEESEQLVAYDPENMTYLGNQLMFFDIGATALLNLGFLGPALHNRLLAVEVAEEFVRREGKPGNANHTLSLMWERTATVQRLMGDDVGAMESLDRAEAAVRPLLELPSPPPFWRRQLIVLDERRGNVAMDAQRYTAAVAFFERFRQDSLAASQASETETLGTSDYFIGGFKAMMAYIRLGEPQEAVRVGRETLARADALLAAGDARARIAQPIVPMVKVTLAFALNAEGKTGEAFSLLEANVQHLTPQLKRVPLEVRPEVELMMLSDPECWQHLMDQIADPAEP